jgi:hypothetical protein
MEDGRTVVGRGAPPAIAVETIFIGKRLARLRALGTNGVHLCGRRFNLQEGVG